MAKKIKVAHLSLSGTVYNEQSIGTEDYGVITKRQVDDFIKANQSADEFHVKIHSVGGDVAEGFAIHDALVNSGKKIVTIGEGLVASIATVIFLAGSTRKLTENTDFFIHNPWEEPWQMSGFTADDYDKMAKEIRQAEEKILNFYIQKTGADPEILKDYMKEQKTLAADLAQELKFSTEIIKTNTQARILAFLPGSRNTKPDPNITEMNKHLKKLGSMLNTIGKEINAALKIEDAVIEITLDDDRIMIVDAAGDAPAAGDSVTIDGAAPEDGDLTDKDGNVYTIAGGMIESITPKAEEGDDAAAKAAADAAKIQAAKDAKDPVKLAAKIQALETTNKNLKASLVAKTKELEEFETEIPKMIKTIEDLGKKYTALAAGTGSSFSPDDEDLDLEHHTPAGKAKPKNIAEAAVAAKTQADKKVAEKKSSIW
jgi:ATP-dependent protease ClpP protease subunit